MNKQQRVVVTGAGIITGAGRGVTEHHNNLYSGETKFIPLSEAIHYLPFRLENFHLSISGASVCPVRMTNEELAELAGVNQKDYDRHQLFALIAATEAMSTLADENVTDYACVGATGGAGLNSIYNSMVALQNGKRLGPRDNLRYLPNLFVGYLTQHWGLGGPSHVHGTACAASTHAVLDLVRLIKLGEIPGGLVVGTEAAISPFGIASFQAQRALGNGLVFHKDRTGFAMGEGAAALVLEAESAALARGAEILGVILGYGESSDAVSDSPITNLSPEGVARAIRRALSSAQLSLDQIDLVKTHATGTKAGDPSELRGLLQVADTNVDEIPVVSLKSHFGHLLGAAGIAETVEVLSFIREGRVLPTRGLEFERDIDPACVIAKHPSHSYSAKLNIVLCNSFGFGGTNVSLVLGKQ